MPANFVQPLAQRNNGWYHPLRHQPATEALGFGLQNLLCFGGGNLTLARIVVDYVLQVVQVI